MIYRIEGKIDPDDIFNRRRSNSTNGKSKEKSKSTKGDNNDIVDPSSLKPIGKDDSSKASNQSFQGDLTDYLAQSRDSYDQFSAFLVCLTKNI